MRDHQLPVLSPSICPLSGPRAALVPEWVRLVEVWPGVGGNEEHPSPPTPWFPEESGPGLLAAQQQQVLFHLGSLPPGASRPPGCAGLCPCTSGTCRPLWPRTVCSTSPRHTRLRPEEEGRLAFLCPGSCSPASQATWDRSCSPGLSPHHLGFAGLEPELFNEVI